MKVRQKTNGYMVIGNVPNIGFVKEFVHEYNENQALLVVWKNLSARYPDIVVPPLGPYCRVIRLSR